MLTDEEKQIANGNGKGSSKRSAKSSEHPASSSNPDSSSPGSEKPDTSSELALAAASQALQQMLQQTLGETTQTVGDLRHQRDRITDYGADQIVQIFSPGSIYCETLLKAFTRLEGNSSRPFVVPEVELPLADPTLLLQS